MGQAGNRAREYINAIDTPQHSSKLGRRRPIELDCGWDPSVHGKNNDKLLNEIKWRRMEYVWKILKY